jgi:hypothetical protein
MVPILLLGLYALLLWLPLTQGAATWLVQENRPVELLTFLMLFVGGLWGIGHARHLRRQGAPRALWGFYACFSAGLLVVAMEEVAWGQQFLRFQTPASWKALNVQDEVTLHNLEGMQGRSGYLYLLFSLAGMWGVRRGMVPKARRYRVPRSLLPWLVTIALFGALHLYLGYEPFSEAFNLMMRRLSEVVELFVGLVAFRFIWYQRRQHADTRPWNSPGHSLADSGARFNFSVSRPSPESAILWNR